MIRALNLLTLAILACVNLTYGIEFRPCSDGKPQPAIVHIEGCPQMPCDIVRGSNSTMTMVYLSRKLMVYGILSVWIVLLIILNNSSAFDAESLRHEVFMTVLGITAQMPTVPGQEIGCDWLTGSSCPIHQGDLVISTHVSVFPPVIYPLLPYVIEFSILDEQNRVMVCFEYDIQIIAA
ncbi:NPC intracellular cholesterol transporter 2-like [Anopheles funestus]|uniref:NPC intracellular cholesterol transporter 2-like n=1 Tax=Anopheles funestus TaxID=62324 RepID=UPI0020C6C604|nr:NPC intracellular cholesterol transporter 2-like [Anopheles funestus]